MSEDPKITLEVARYRPGEDERPTMQQYEVPLRDDWVVLDALNYIKDEVDGTLSYRWSCRMGVCGSCGMMVNGVPKLTCAAFLRDLAPGPIRVEALQHFPIERDLVTVLDDFIEKLEYVTPWIVRDEPEPPPEDGEYKQTPAELATFKQYSMCINCMLCYSACPVYGQEPEFIGPAALALAQRYNLDSRDEGERPARDGDRLAERRLGLYVRERVQRGVSEACRSGGGDPAAEAGKRGRVVREPAGGAQQEEEVTVRKPYYQRPSSTWWLKRWPYRFFMLREISSVFIAGYGVLLVVLAMQVYRGPSHLVHYVNFLDSPVMLVVHAIVLAFALLHTITFFNLTPKAVVVRIGERKLSTLMLVAPIYTAWLVVSALVALLFPAMSTIRGSKGAA